MPESSVDEIALSELNADGPLVRRDKPDSVADPAGEAGWYLEREREAREITLDQAGDATGIHPHHIEAIEYGDFTHLPGREDALEMIAVYAEFLGFDPEPLVEHYAAIMAPPAARRLAVHPANPAPLSSAKILKFGHLPALPKISFRPPHLPGGTGGLVATVAAVIFLFAGASYVLLPAGDAGRATPVATTPPGPQTSSDPMPTASTADEAAQVTVSEEPMTDDQAAASQAYTEDDLAGTNLDGLSGLIQTELPASPAAASDLGNMVEAADMAQTADGREFGASNAESRVTLKAKAPVWVRIEDAQGNVVMTQMLMKGDTYRVPNREGLVVIARDGGLLSYVIDGKEKGILGTPGEILVGRSLDPQSFEGNG